MNTNSQIALALLDMLQRGEPMERITACAFLRSGARFLERKEREQIKDQLCSMIGDRDVVCDHGYVGEHVVAALVELDDSLQAVKELASDPNCSQEQWENLFNGVYDAISDANARSITIRMKGMSFLLAAVRDFRGAKRLDAASAMELTTCELGAAAADAAVEISKIMQRCDPTSSAELREALGWINLDRAIGHLTGIRNQLKSVSEHKSKRQT